MEEINKYNCNIVTYERKMDELGRYPIPMKYRKLFNWNEKDTIQAKVNLETKEVILSKLDT